MSSILAVLHDFRYDFSLETAIDVPRPSDDDVLDVLVDIMKSDTSSRLSAPEEDARLEV